MEIKTADGSKNVASAGVGGAGLGLGIAGTALALLNGGLMGLANGGPGGAAFSREEYKLRADLAQEKSERYADSVGLNAYKLTNDKISELTAVVYELDKKIAVDGQSIRDNFAFLNSRIDNTKAEIISYANATFVPGALVMPLDSICPQPMPAKNSWTAPTTTTTATTTGS